jgi:transposase-like protein
MEHRQHKGLNNRAENSHQPTRLREKKMRRFRINPHKHNAFSPPSASSLDISNHEDIACVPRSTAPFCKADSNNETRVTGVKPVG